MNTTQGPLPRGWRLAACLLAGLMASPWAQAQQTCSAQSFNGMQVQPAAGQTLLEFNAGNDYQPYLIALRTNKNLPAGGSYTWKQVNPVPPAEPVPASRAVALDTTDQTAPKFLTRDFGPGGATLAFQVTARCNGTAVATATGSITIQNVDRPPSVTALATPPIASAGDGVSLAATGSDPDGDAIAYQWLQVANGAPAVSLGAPTSATTTFVAPAAASDYTLEFQVTATSNALSSTDTVVVNVSAVNLPPQASLTCTDPVDEGAPLLLDGSATYDPEGDALTYAWSVDSAPAGLDLALDDEAGATVQRNAPALGEGMDGAVVVRLRVGDGTQYTDATCAFMIHDATAPQLQLPADLLLDADSAAGTQVPSYAVSAHDNVDGDVGHRIACDPAAPHLFPLATSTVACSVDDSAGNAAQGSFHVTVADLSPPVIAAHADIAREATGPQTDVPYDLPATSDQVDGAGLASCAPPPGPFAVGSTTVTCEAADHAGNPAVPTQFTVTVHDTTPPVIAVPADLTAEATAPSGAAVTYAISASDLVSGNVAVDCDHASGSTFPLGATTVHCSAHDAAVRDGFPQGNVATASFTVTVQDTTAPDLVMPAPVTLEATGPLTTLVYGAASATDLVDTDVAIACTPVSGSAFAVGVTSVTCTATDDAGNASTGTVAMTVTDTTAPALSLPADITAEATGPGGASVAWTATANDLVDGARAVSCTPASGSTFALGTTTVDCSAGDTRGNTAHGSFTVTVQDTTSPAIAPHPDVTATATANSQAAVTYASPTAYDIVDGALATTCTPASGATFNVGSTTVNCSVTDGHGNTATSTFEVIVSYAFSGFFRPVDKLPTLNVVKAGQAIPVKFSLGGNQGLAIFASGYPKAILMSCTGNLQDAVEETVTAGGSSLQYDATSGQYIYVWKSDKAWAGSCRQLQLAFADGSTQAANFSFTR